MTPVRPKAWLLERADGGLALGLFVGYLALLLASAESLGFTRDEGFYFSAARAYEQWFALLGSSPSEALSKQAVDRFWSVNSEHPALIKSLFALSHRWLGGLTVSSERIAQMYGPIGADGWRTQRVKA